MERRRITIIGVITILTILLFIWGINFLKGKNIFSGNKVYYTVFQQVNGLGVGSPVTIKGYKIGQISKIYLDNAIGSEIIVTFNIKKDIQIPKNSVVELYNSDMFGTRGLKVLISNEKEFHHEGDTMLSSVNIWKLDELAGKFEPLRVKSEKLITTLDTVANLLNKLMVTNENAINLSLENIGAITTNLRSITSNLNNNLLGKNGELQIIMSNFSSISKTLKENEQNLDNIINNFSTVSDSISQIDFAKLDSTLTNLQDITRAIKNSEGSLGLLINEDTLYRNIENISRNLDILVEDIKDNPFKYFNISLIGKNKK